MDDTLDKALAKQFMGNFRRKNPIMNILFILSEKFSRSCLRMLREPLLHFLLLGAALFGVYALVGDRPADPSGRMLVTQGKVEHLVTGFTRTWQRPPTEQELQGLIEDYIKEEIYNREALAMGLDRDDTIVRRRLRQKLEFLSEDLAEIKSPADEELKAFLQKNPDPFRKPPKLAFHHVYVNSDKRGKSADADARQMLAKLNSGANPETLGDIFLLPLEFELSDAREIAKLFGEKFTKALQAIEPGRWAGPVESGYGLHLVLLRKREDAGIPELGEVREAAEREWFAARRNEFKEAAYRALREKYTVTVERHKGARVEPAKVAEAR